MTPFEQAFLATSLLAIFFYFGKYLGKQERVEDIVEHTFNMLEKYNMIKVKKCEKTGEKEILPIDKTI
jgi:hypothetical protein